MSYQAKRRELYKEDFDLTEEDGTVVHTIHVALDADSMVKKLSEKHLALIRALQEVQKAGEGGAAERLNAISQAAADMVEAVFGPEDARLVMDFYSGRSIEMCREILPFLTEVVIPGVRDTAQKNRAQIAAGYGRKRRKFLGKK